MTRYEIGAIVLAGSAAANVLIVAYNTYLKNNVKKIERENNQILEEFADEVSKIASEERPVTNDDVKKLRNIYAKTTRIELQEEELPGLIF